MRAAPWVARRAPGQARLAADGDPSWTARRPAVDPADLRPALRPEDDPAVPRRAGAAFAQGGAARPTRRGDRTSGRSARARSPVRHLYSGEQRRASGFRPRNALLLLGVLSRRVSQGAELRRVT